MNTPRYRLLARSLVTLVVLAAAAQALCAQTTAPLVAVGASAAPATITGRVLNQATARLVNNARVIVKGTALQTFTDSAGVFFLDGLPPGPVTLIVSFTNLPAEVVSVNLVSGQRAELNVTLGATDGATVKLDEFRVSAARETDAQSIAANEQRYSRNLKSVTTTDSMGEITGNNIGEFVKYLPGVGIEYQGSDIIRLTVRGLSSDTVEVTSDGLGEASVFADAGENNRAPRLTQSSTVGIARIEVRKVPLPSDSANAMGGSVNMVRRTAFEYAKREVSL